MRTFLFGCLVVGAAAQNATCATPEYPDIRSVPQDIFTPNMTDGQPGAGLRVRQTEPSYAAAGSKMYHSLYLPRDWVSGSGRQWPLIVEFTGNGPWSSPYGDVSCGLPWCANMGYGLSAGEGYIWVVLPFGNVNGSANQAYWWGCPNASNSDCPGYFNATPTLDYAQKTVRWVADTYSGNASAVLLTGWSRGALAVMYMGLHDDVTAALWSAFAPYSHFDGRSTDQWEPYPAHDPASAISRLQRLNGRPVFITEERNGTVDTLAFLANATASGALQPSELNTIAMTTTFCNHNDAWTLRPSTTRALMREWMAQVLH